MYHRIKSDPIVHARTSMKLSDGLILIERKQGNTRRLFIRRWKIADARANEIYLTQQDESGGPRGPETGVEAVSDGGQ